MQIPFAFHPENEWGARRMDNRPLNINKITNSYTCIPVYMTRSEKGRTDIERARFKRDVYKM
jgi:hypothetical protein